jgi:hypothetical protein
LVELELVVPEVLMLEPAVQVVELVGQEVPL